MIVEGNWFVGNLDRAKVLAAAQRRADKARMAQAVHVHAARPGVSCREGCETVVPRG